MRNGEKVDIGFNNVFPLLPLLQLVVVDGEILETG
jgi:hypothetical protein